MSTRITALPASISVPGSYHLESNLSCAGTAISVLCSDVMIDFRGHSITGSFDPANAGHYGVAAFNFDRVRIYNGTIRGFMYGIYLSDLADYVRPNGSFNGGMHVIEGMNISDCYFRGIRVEGSGNVIRKNIIRRIGGTTAYPNAYAFGVESLGPGALIEENFIYETRGFGVADIGEGVGISVSDYGSGNVVRANTITQSSRDLSSQFTDWPAASRSSYGIWIGGDGDVTDVLCEGNVVNNFVYGITYRRTASGVLARNSVNNAVVPYYLPNLLGNAYGAKARDGGGNQSDMLPTDCPAPRVTPGQFEYVEQSYLTAR